MTEIKFYYCDQCSKSVEKNNVLIIVRIAGNKDNHFCSTECLNMKADGLDDK